ncbi:hypothetical protein Bca101_005777 [Brassica carinata]
MPHLELVSHHQTLIIFLDALHPNQYCITLEHESGAPISSDQKFAGKVGLYVHKVTSRSVSSFTR